MSMREDMRRWKMIQDRLSAEANGKEPRPFASQRTLFGIRSSVEEQIDQIVREDEARRLQARQGTRADAGPGAALTGEAGSGLLAP